ncbi:MAG: hypothetical protein WCF84_13765 [Anaerolineae bacterium]
MSINLFLVLAVLSIIITPIVVLLIPRARRSPAFDRLLWGATLFVAFLGGWYAFGIADPDHPLSGVVIAGIPVLSVAIGALVGAMAVNLPLWLLDRFERPDHDADQMEWDDELEDDLDDEVDQAPANPESSIQGENVPLPPQEQEQENKKE